MSDVLTKEQRHICMSHIKGKNTSPEIKIRKRLWADGYRFRINVRTLPGSPDIVLPRFKTVIFINGCFWHSHEGCRNFVFPKSNTKFWEDKLLQTKRRDEKAIQDLKSLGWNVLVIWECETKGNQFENSISKIESSLTY